MKCGNCGYIEPSEAVQDTFGDKAFIKIDGKFTTETGDAYHRNMEDVRLYACPSCRVVQISDIP